MSTTDKLNALFNGSYIILNISKPKPSTPLKKKKNKKKKKTTTPQEKNMKGTTMCQYLPKFIKCTFIYLFHLKPINARK